jgi:hypothetical protein
MSDIMRYSTVITNTQFVAQHSPFRRTAERPHGPQPPLDPYHVLRNSAKCDCLRLQRPAGSTTERFVETVTVTVYSNKFRYLLEPTSCQQLAGTLCSHELAWCLWSLGALVALCHLSLQVFLAVPFLGLCVSMPNMNYLVFRHGSIVDSSHQL